MMRVRVKPSAARRFEEVCARLGVAPADAHRQALAQWVSRQETR